MKKNSCNAATKAATWLLLLGLTLSAKPILAIDSNRSLYAQSSVNDSKDHLSEDDRSQAKIWKLTDTEWARFKDIMSGRRGVWSPGLDPVTALGVHAETEEERIRYAELWVRLEYERTEKELAFERARMNAAKRLYPDQKAINNQPFIEQFKAKNATQGQQMALFTGLDCESCSTVIPNIYKSMGAKGRLDIYVKGATEAEIIAWASEKNIPPDLVQTRAITLNIAAFSDMMKLGVYGNEPKLFRIDENGKAQEISM